MKKIAEVCAVTLLLSSTAGCMHQRMAVKTPLLIEDSINNITVRQGNGASLRAGTPSSLTVKVEYTLQSYREGFLSMNLVQFPNAKSCVPADGQSVDLVKATADGKVLLPIKEGTHTAIFNVAWNGKTRATGAVSFEASLWSQHPRYQFLTRSFGTDYCMQVQLGK